jgi:tetratricopeptide repeat protein 30
MQDNRYLEAIQYYEPIVKKSVDNILSAPPIVLANLCVSYIMTNQVLFFMISYIMIMYII